MKWDDVFKSLKINEDDADDDQYLDEEDEDTPAAPVNSDAGEEPKRSIVKPITRNKQVKQSSADSEICVIVPKSFEETHEITDALLTNKSVVLNMEGIDIDLAQRIIDYSFGTVYAIRGNLQRISNYVFLITPESAKISGDYLDLKGVSIEAP